MAVEPERHVPSAGCGHAREELGNRGPAGVEPGSAVGQSLPHAARAVEDDRHRLCLRQVAANRDPRRELGRGIPFGCPRGRRRRDRQADDHAMAAIPGRHVEDGRAVQLDAAGGRGIELPGCLLRRRRHGHARAAGEALAGGPACTPVGIGVEKLQRPAIDRLGEPQRGKAGRHAGVGGEADFVARRLDTTRRRKNKSVGGNVEVGKPVPLRGERIDLRRQAGAVAVSEDDTVAPDDLCRRLDQQASLVEAIDRLVRLNAPPKLLQRRFDMIHQPFVPCRGEGPLRGRCAVADPRTLPGHGSQTTAHPAPTREQFEHPGIAVAAADLQLGTLAVEAREDCGEGSRRRPDGGHLTTDVCGDVRRRRGQRRRAEGVGRDEGKHWIHQHIPPGHPSRHGGRRINWRKRIVALRWCAGHQGSLATIEGVGTSQQPHSQIALRQRQCQRTADGAVRARAFRGLRGQVGATLEKDRFDRREQGVAAGPQFVDVAGRRGRRWLRVTRGHRGRIDGKFELLDRNEQRHDVGRLNA